jgi:hypothetical protein
VTDQSQAAMPCPKDGAAMRQMGRRGGAWRCPDCRSIFIDTEAMRRGRSQRPPAWFPLLVSVVATMLVCRVARRLCRASTCCRSGD